jgi:CheY-like chemotaxis protein
MPLIDGIEMIRRIRAMGPMRRFIPILAVTAYQIEHGPKALEAGASLVLAKPFKEDSLLACVKDLLELGTDAAASARH